VERRSSASDSNTARRVQRRAVPSILTSPARSRWPALGLSLRTEPRAANPCRPPPSTRRAWSSMPGVYLLARNELPVASL